MKSLYFSIATATIRISILDEQGKEMAIDWQTTYAAIWRAKRQALKAVSDLDEVALDSLLGVDAQKQQLLWNTRRFVEGEPANHALLWGARGTGKSSMVKAVFAAFCRQGLRLVEIDKPDLQDLPEVLDELRHMPQRFIVFCDDLSFEYDDDAYKSLKRAIEGSIERPPANVLFYATSNRRHLLPESMSDNVQTRLIGGEVHYADAVEERISLSDRFGLRLAFYPMNTESYLQIIEQNMLVGNVEQLRKVALDFAHLQGAKSGRAAQQFLRAYSDAGA
jgi:uncharacterized protein